MTTAVESGAPKSDSLQTTPGLFRTMSGWLRRLWSGDAAGRRDVPAVIVHDPAAAAPHDLDDPFFDRGVQARMADVIAGVHNPDKI